MSMSLDKCQQVIGKCSLTNITSSTTAWIFRTHETSKFTVSILPSTYGHYVIFYMCVGQDPDAGCGKILSNTQHHPSFLGENFRKKVHWCRHQFQWNRGHFLVSLRHSSQKEGKIIIAIISRLNTLSGVL